ncbi:FAD-binding oxidoreductase [Rhodobacteraceae bacterium NNCM2]|nr:FAD-binding oxidoreductase [Coraliihabitans acroporae]
MALPKAVDVLIVGSGYTGMSAAIQTARAGRQTLIVDAEAPGWGCSSRNGGQISTSIKPKFPELARKFGPDRAFGIIKEGHNALQWIGDFIEDEGIDCAFRRNGRFFGAHSPSSYDQLAKSYETEVPGLETGTYVVPKAEQHKEIGTDYYHGGVVNPRHASLDPGQYHNGLYDRAVAAGAQVVSNCRVEGITGSPGNFEVTTARGKVTARNVIVATSGYTSKLTPWHQRRIIPIGSYVLATEPLAPDVIERLIPNDRVITDTKRLVVYYRTCPERRRILFGGRVSITETNVPEVAPALHAEMTKIFPELAQTPMTHAWMGFVGYTFDSMPHMGVHEGIHYSMGYCGSGVSLSSYMGMKIGQQVLGLSEGASPLSETPFETRAYYWGKPWFLAPSIGYYKWRDRSVA